MKKLHLFKTVLLLCALVVGSLNGWAAKITNYNDIVSGKKYYIGATTSSTDYYLSVDGSTTGNGKSGTAVTSKENATVFVFSGSGTSWTIMFDGTSNYLALATSKANGKVNVVSSSHTWTASNASTLLQLASDATYYLQKNNSGTQFGSYAHTQTNIWLEEASSDPTVEVSEDDLDFSDIVIGASKSLSFDVTQANLTGALTVASNNAKYTVDKTSIAQGAGKTTVTVTAAPTALGRIAVIPKFI